MTARIVPFFTRAKTGAVERAFLPAALEIVETPASPTVRLTSIVIALCLVTAVTWAYFGQVDIVATAPGKIIAKARTKVVQPYETGVVRAIHVADGDHVVPGQVLIELDPTMSVADTARYRDMLTQAQVDRARLAALISPTSGDPFVEVKAPADMLASARARLTAEQAEQAAKLAKLDRELAQHRSEQAGIEAEEAKIDASLPLVRGRAQIRLDSMKIEYGSRLQYLEAQQAVVEMEHQRIVLERKHDESDATLAQLAVERVRTDAEFRRGVLTDLEKANKEATDATGELAKATQRTDLQTLTAPVAGVVQDLAVHTLGGVVTPAQQLLRIVPEDGGIEVEAVVANSDVGFVEVGQEAEVKVDTFPFTRYGLLRGQVRAIAHDSVDQQSEEQRRQGSQSASDETSNVERSRNLVYTARIALDRTNLVVDDDRTVDLVPGMSVTAEIKTGKRRVLDYLFSPFHRYTHDVLRER
jgi:HlyD family type I secretion membrane fusion protein